MMTLSLRDASITMHLGQRSVEGIHKGRRRAARSAKAKGARVRWGSYRSPRCKSAPIDARVLADFLRIAQGAECAREDARRARALPGTDSLCNLTHRIAHKLCDFIFSWIFLLFLIIQFLGLTSWYYVRCRATILFASRFICVVFRITVTPLMVS